MKVEKQPKDSAIDNSCNVFKDITNNPVLTRGKKFKVLSTKNTSS
jgi:hypothetical protein